MGVQHRQRNDVVRDQHLRQQLGLRHGSIAITQRYHPPNINIVGVRWQWTLYIREGGGMRSHQPASINYQTNTGFTSLAIDSNDAVQFPILIHNGRRPSTPAKRLPSGLTFSLRPTAAIYGTPTELWTQTSYMVWANNSGGYSTPPLANDAQHHRG